MLKTDCKNYLKKVSLFSDLTEQELDSLSEFAVLRRFRKNQIIIRTEEHSTTFFIIVSGRVKVSLETEKGEEFIVDILEPLEYFGELALLDGSPRSATVAAIDPTEVIIFSRETFLVQLKKHPEIQFKLLKEFCKRLRQANYRIESLVFLDVCGRLARLLLDVAQTVGAQHAVPDQDGRQRPSRSLNVGAQDFVPFQENPNESVGTGLGVPIMQSIGRALVETQYTLSRSVGTSSCRKEDMPAGSSLKLEPTTDFTTKGNSIEIKLDISRGDLAAQIGTAREVLSRALKTLESLGLIKVEGDKVFITDTQALRERAM